MKLSKTLLSIGIFSLISLNASDSNSVKHYGLSALFGFTSETIIHKNYYELSDVKKVAYGTLLGTTPGLVKELTDDKFSKQDMAYNFIGALSGALLSNYVNNNTTIFISHNKKREATNVKVAYKF